jgi:hypothetical protein
MPALGMSWNEMARFVNWLNTSSGFPAAYKFSTQPGDAGYNANENIELWQPGDAGHDPSNLFRNSQARYFLPSVHELYKAAYYDPNANGGAGGYWDYPTGSDSEPTAVASGTEPGTAVYKQTREQGPADVSLAGGQSPYGVIGLGGNVGEQSETEAGDYVNVDVSSYRRIMGGLWSGTNVPLHSDHALASSRDPTYSNVIVGFRVASVAQVQVLAGDYNGDSRVDQADLDLVLLNWGADAATPPVGWVSNLPTGLVDQQELDSLLLNWGSAAPARASIGTPSGVPEPMTSTMLFLIGITAAVKRVQRGTSATNH